MSSLRRRREDISDHNRQGVSNVYSMKTPLLRHGVPVKKIGISNNVERRLTEANKLSPSHRPPDYIPQKIYRPGMYQTEHVALNIKDARHVERILIDIKSNRIYAERELVTNTAERLKREFQIIKENNCNTEYCDRCKDPGDLVCCDGCPRSFHLPCKGLRKIPKGEWYCGDCETPINRKCEAYRVHYTIYGFDRH
jgi:hypothetical protein